MYDRDAGRHEQAEEAEPVPVEAVDHHQTPDEDGQRNGHDRLGGNGEEIGEHAPQVAGEDEQEERENEREEAHPRLADGVPNRAHDELVDQLDARLETSRDDRLPPRPKNQEQRDDRQRQDHEERGVGKGKVEPADIDRDQALDLELFDRTFRYDFHAFPSSAARAVIRSRSERSRFHQSR